MNAQKNAQETPNADTALTQAERAELVRLAKLSAKDSGPAFVILPRELKRLQRLDNRTLSAVVQEVALNFAEIDGGDAFDAETRALVARMTEAQAAYTEAWIAERRRRNLPILAQTATGRGQVYLAHGNAKGGAR